VEEVVGPRQDLCILGDCVYFWGKRSGAPELDTHLWRYDLRVNAIQRALTDEQEKPLAPQGLAQLTACPRTGRLAGVVVRATRTSGTQQIASEIVLLEAGTGRCEVLADNGRYNTFPQFSPDGSAVAFYDASAELEWHKWDYTFKGFALSAVEVAGKKLRTIVAEDWRHMRDGPPSWSPDGRYLAYSGLYDWKDNSQIYIVPQQGGEPRRVSPPGARGCCNPVWVTDDLLLYSGYASEGGLYAVRRDGTGNRLLFRGAVGSAPDVSPDGRRLCFWGVALPSANLRQQAVVLDIEGRILPGPHPDQVLGKWRR
jgi:Tol biopolymer transport system component